MPLPLQLTAYDLAQRYVGVGEREGRASHPLITWWLELCGLGRDQPDEVPWCSAFVNGVAWELRLPRSKNAAARSWLTIGLPVAHRDAQPGFDVVILKRGEGEQPGPEVTSGSPGHVGFFAGFEGPHHDSILVLGGNQSDSVNVRRFAFGQLLGVRRLLT